MIITGMIVPEQIKSHDRSQVAAFVKKGTDKDDPTGEKLWVGRIQPVFLRLPQTKRMFIIRPSGRQHWNRVQLQKTQMLLLTHMEARSRMLKF